MLGANRCRRWSGEDREGDSVLGARDGSENVGDEDDEIIKDDGGDALPSSHAEVDEAAGKVVGGDANDEADPKTGHASCGEGVVDDGVGARLESVRILPSFMSADFGAMGGSGGHRSRSEGRWPEGVMVARKGWCLSVSERDWERRWFGEVGSRGWWGKRWKQRHEV